MLEIKQKVIELNELMYRNNLSDISGGNVSIRVKDRIYITPKLMGYTYFGKVTTDHITTLDLNGNVIEGKYGVSREGKLHVGMYQTFKDVNCVLHAHPAFISAFIAKSLNLPPVLEIVEKWGEIQSIPFTKGHSPELAEVTVREIKKTHHIFEKTGANAILLPKHGIIAIGKDCNAALDILMREEINARTIIYGKLLQ